MRGHRGLAGLVFVLSPAGLVQAQADRPDYAVPTREDLCERADFTGALKKHSLKESPSGLYCFELKYTAQGEAAPRGEDLDAHYASLSPQCRRRCETAYTAFRATLNARDALLDTFDIDAVEAVKRTVLTLPKKDDPTFGKGGLDALGNALAPACFQDDAEKLVPAIQAAQAAAEKAEQGYKACACRCRVAGLSTGVKVGGGAGLVALTVGIVSLAGGDGGAGAPRAAGPLPQVPPVGSAPLDPQGPYGFLWSLLEDIQSSGMRVGLQNAQQGSVTFGPGAPPGLSRAGWTALLGAGASAVGASRVAVTIMGDPPLPSLMGTWDAASQQINATGAGPLAGRARVGVSLVGTLTPAGVLNATVTVGEDGSLGPPLPHIVRYGLVGNKRP